MESNKLTNVIIDGEYDAFEWGWYVEPDPDSMLAYLTCDQRGVWNDAWWCSEEYDALYEQQQRRERRRDRVGPGQADAGDLLLGRALPGDGVHLIGEACAATGGPASSRSPTRAGSWLIQYGIHNYLQHAAGRRGRRLRRGRRPRSARRIAERRRRRRPRAERRGQQHGRPGRRRGRAGRTGHRRRCLSRCGDAARRPTASDPMTQGAEPEPPTEAAPAGGGTGERRDRAAQELRPLRPAARSPARPAAWRSSWWSTSSCSGCCRATRPARWAGASSRPRSSSRRSGRTTASTSR